MARYYFHICDRNSIIPDDEGMELSGMPAARAEAIRSADDLVRAGTCVGGGGARTIETADESGQSLDVIAIRRVLN